MIIKKIDIYRLDVPFEHAIKVPLGVLHGAENIAVKVSTNEGLVGWGEGSGFGPITGDDQGTNLVTARKLAGAIVGKDPIEIAERMLEINAVTVGDPSARSAFDMALHDLAAQAANMPLYKFLGGGRRDCRTDLTIGFEATPADTASRAEEILSKGFDAIKLKVGRPDLVDVDHVRAVRKSVGNDVSIKIDSNQGWDYTTALLNLRAMSDLNILYAEQPIASWDVLGLQRLRKNVSIPICADESVFTDKDAMLLAQLSAVDFFNIKLGKAGGVAMGDKINAVAEAHGAKCMIGCFAESRLGLTAAAHLAMARPNIRFLDLDSAFYLAEDPVIGGMTYDENQGGVLHLTDEPGLGAKFNEEFLTHHTVIEA